MSDKGSIIFGGRYELKKRIARGGMAEVFLGEDQLLGRPVAVKVFFPNLRAIQILSSASEEKPRQLQS